MGTLHAAVLDDTPLAQVVAWCDPDPLVTQRAPEHIEVLSSPRDLKGIPDLEAVVVATPADAHLEVVEEALSAGLWVLCEKPIAARLDHGEALAELAEATGRLFFGHTLRFDPNYHALALAVHAGEVGDVASASARRAVPDFEGRALAQKTTLPVEVMVHDIDLLRTLCGDITEVHAVDGGHAAGSTLAVAAVARFAGGAVGLIEANWATASASGHSSDYRLAVFGTEGSAYAEFRHPPVVAYRQGGPSFPRTDWYTEINGRRPGVLRNQAEHFLSQVRGLRSEWPCTAQDALAALRVALAMDESISIGQPVTVHQPIERR